MVMLSVTLLNVVVLSVIAPTFCRFRKPLQVNRTLRGPLSNNGTAYLKNVNNCLNTNIFTLTWRHLVVKALNYVDIVRHILNL